jgi:DNA-binding Lrp family transcriptional regulator
MVDLRFRLKIFIGALIVIIILGTLGFRFTEGLSLADAFYFSIVTVATVGYGDIHPSTEPGKFLAIFMILCGVGTFLGVVANATEMIVNRREKQIRLQKTNVVLGTFFSETGTQLLNIFTAFDQQAGTIGKALKVTGNWSKKEFSEGKRLIESYDFSVDIHSSDLESLSRFLEEKGDSMLRHMENPALLEHESFTDLLQAIIHLRDEFLYRTDLRQLPDSDYRHLAGDMQRAYRRLVYQWLDYMNYLKDNYPYLFQLAVRTNPFDPDASPIVT